MRSETNARLGGAPILRAPSNAQLLPVAVGKAKFSPRLGDGSAEGGARSEMAKLYSNDTNAINRTYAVLALPGTESRSSHSWAIRHVFTLHAIDICVEFV